MTGDPLMSVRDVAGRLAVSQKSVRAAIARGELPAVKVCNSVRIDPADLENYISAGRVKPQTGRPTLVRQPFSNGHGPLSVLLRSDRGGKP
jgi:excisionase family DNA binding protein